MLSDAGHEVYKIHFQRGMSAGAAWAITNASPASRDTWNTFFRRFIKRHGIDSLICYGDCRYYHQKVIRICKLEKSVSGASGGGLPASRTS